MKREHDYVRKLLFEFEENDGWLFLMPGTTHDADEQELKERYHILLMIDDGLMTEVERGTIRLTAAGHDYIDAIRSDTVWKKTKEGASKVGGMTLAMMKDLALAYLKQEVAEKLGINL